MRARAWVVLLVFAVGVGVAAAAARAQEASPSMPMGGLSSQMGKKTARAAVPIGPLKITFGGKSAEWTPANLAALPHTTITVYNMHAKANETYAGVPVIDLLTRLGVPAQPHGKDYRLYLVAEGSDGYQVVYSIGEVNPAVHDATVLVADAMDGKPLGADGPFKIVATSEKRPARWVRNLVAIRVQEAQ